MSSQRLLSSTQKFFSSIQQICRNEQRGEKKRKTFNNTYFRLEIILKIYQKRGMRQQRGLLTVDYVMLFMGIESALITAMDEDPSPQDLAIEKNIVLVSQFMLLPALRSVALSLRRHSRIGEDEDHYSQS